MQSRAEEAENRGRGYQEEPMAVRKKRREDGGKRGRERREGERDHRMDELIMVGLIPQALTRQ